MVEARLIWQEGLQFEARTPSGHAFRLDSAHQGMGAGPSPMELVLVALGGCTGMDVISILQKQRQPVTGLEVVVQAERADEHPKVYTGYEVTYIVHGKGIDPKAVERAVNLSAEKYCSVGLMLEKAAPIRRSIRLVEE
ncbi:MAG: OsmC family protein [Chloroflexia bacterium]